MKIGTAIRNMGNTATAACIRQSAATAEAAGLDHVWVVDHLAIPPDQAEGSDGRWVDPLAALAFLAAATQRVGLGVAVLVLPYRPALPTAKWVASIQALSEGRLHLGVAAGWMAAEFRALGVDFAHRGRTTDATLDFLRACFDAPPDDVVSAHGQDFLFRPRPPRPPIYVGGMSDAALARAVRAGDGWLPIGLDVDQLAPRIARLGELAAAAARDCPEIVLMGTLPDSDDDAVERLARLAALDATQYIQASRYHAQHEFDALVTRLARIRDQLA
ncbi:MAG: TIGR03619 family F420-dependent LLM class oxidoreductase [Gammaproteobacteria bacterium]